MEPDLHTEEARKAYNYLMAEWGGEHFVCTALQRSKHFDQWVCHGFINGLGYGTTGATEREAVDEMITWIKILTNPDRTLERSMEAG